MSEFEELTSQYFDSDPVLDHYAEATANVGLWQSEERIVRKVFSPEDRLLDLGCGTGRIAFGLHELGFSHVLGADCSRPMVQRARRLATLLEYPVSFQVADATRLKFDDALFDGVIFGFNGLMQIAGEEARCAALREIRRILRPGGTFVFTTHDRDHYCWADYWEAEARRWKNGKQDPRLERFGDRCVESEIGTYLIHVPTADEVVAILEKTGWTGADTALREELALEPVEVRDFSDACRFWVAKRPEND